MTLSNQQGRYIGGYRHVCKAVHILGLIRRFVMSLTNWPNNGMLVREFLFMRFM